MQLVFDTSALITLADTDQDTGALTSALHDANAQVWVPASVVFELHRQVRAWERANPGVGEIVGPPPRLAWVVDGWARGLLCGPASSASDTPHGPVLPFSGDAALFVEDWLSKRIESTGQPRWFEVQKLRKAHTDARPLVNKALDRMAERVGDLESFKLSLANHASSVLDSYSNSVPRVSGTIDWLHLGTALEKKARLVSDDHGIEFDDDRVIRTVDLFSELGLPWHRRGRP